MTRTEVEFIQQPRSTANLNKYIFVFTAATLGKTQPRKAVFWTPRVEPWIWPLNSKTMSFKSHCNKLYDLSQSFACSSDVWANLNVTDMTGWLRSLLESKKIFSLVALIDWMNFKVWISQCCDTDELLDRAHSNFKLSFVQSWRAPLLSLV